MATVSEIIPRIAAFLKDVGGIECQMVRGQANQVPPPKGVDFIVITPIGLPQYTTTRMRYVDSSVPGIDGTMFYDMPTKLAIQLDFYGLKGGDFANIAVTLFRSLASNGFFQDGVFPLFCTDAMQAPLIDAEKQYLDRWSSTLTLQYNQPVAVKTASFNAVGDVYADPTNVTTPLE